MPSLSLAEKLNQRFAQDQTVMEAEEMLSMATSPAAFGSKAELQQYLMEGCTLNIGRLSAKALSIPHGEYMVWMTTPGHTSLLPTKAVSQEVYENRLSPYEIFTRDLLNNWNAVEKTLNERSPFGGPPEGPGAGPEGPEANDAASGPPEEEEGEKNNTETPEGSPFKSKIQMHSVDRTPIVRAMQQHGFTVSSLASAVGVEPPAISRILRRPKDTQGDPGGRNPSLPLAARIAHVLKLDAEALFPDIFGIPTQDFQARDTPANRGSGMSGAAAGSRKKGKASQKFTAGNK